MKTDFEIQQELESIFDEAINDSYESVIIAGIEFLPADILKSCDPIAYRCALADFESDYLESLEN
jgi:hypothetical protein